MVKPAMSLSVYIGDRLHYVVYTMREDQCRVISLRKANSREERQYAQA